MKYILNFTIFTFFAIPVVFGQVLDVPPKGKQNLLPVEGGSIRMKIDSITPLNKLIDKLNDNWQFLETGKAYWIGYTDDMFSIASRGDSAIPALLDFFAKTRNKKGKIGVLFTLHLIGIDRTIVGRFSEEFKNTAARSALLNLLPDSAFTYPIMELLMRDPWKSDIPYLFQILQREENEETCWPIINSLNRYNITDLPVTSYLPDSLLNLSVMLYVENEKTPERDINFNAQIKKALLKFRSQYPEQIDVEDKLLDNELSKYFTTELDSILNIGTFFFTLGIQRHNPFGYVEIGCKLQYYVDNGKLYFITIGTARQRLLKWWHALPVDEKNKFR